MNRNQNRSRRRRTDLLALWGCLVLTASMPGCQPRTAPPARPAAGAEMDPCAERLHDLCGQLLLYCAIHKELPARLEDLGESASRPAAPLVCPISGKPYVYDPQGLQVPGWPGWLIVYDAEPSHSGMRWGILAEPPRPGKPLVIRVVRPPETAIPPAQAPEPK